MKHKFDAEDWKAKQQAKADLGKPHSAANTVPELRARDDKIERSVGVVSNEE